MIRSLESDSRASTVGDQFTKRLSTHRGGVIMLSEWLHMEPWIQGSHETKNEPVVDEGQLLSRPKKAFFKAQKDTPESDRHTV